MDPETDFKADPGYFQCIPQKAWLRRELCVKYQDAAARADDHRGNAYICINGYDRMLTCLDCEQGRQIRQTVNHAEPLRVTFKVKPKNISPKPTIRKKIIERQTVDWDALMRAYNKANGKSYRAVKHWLATVYQQHDRVLTYTANAIGVSPDALRTKFKHLRIKIKGHSESGKAKFLAIPDAEMAGMTKLDIARRTGLAVATVGMLLNRHNRRYVMAGAWRGKKRK